MDGEKSSFAPLINPSCSSLLLLFIFIAILTLQIATRTPFPIWMPSSTLATTDTDSKPTCSVFFHRDAAPETVVMSITDFGGVGDGRTSNTEAFRKAIEYMRRFGETGGSKLIVPKGSWVTGSFNLTTNFTLFLQRGAVILGSQDPDEWPIIEPLPSYGRGRERLGGRHISLIHGNALSNVLITGENGTIDGQGKMWWDLWWNRTLNHTRGHLIELINSHNILISNLTLKNSPFWTVHPVYCSNVVIKNMTILAPLNAPNTDGIDPDSSTNICIEDCYIESGDDLVAVKSGWDQYGINLARPSSNIIIRRVSGTTPTCSGVGIGSEMSGGISNITIDDLNIWDSAAGVRIKSDQGRGGYIANISISNFVMNRVKMAIRFSKGSNDHPDEEWDPKAVPIVKGIFISNITSLNSTKAPVLNGIEGTLFDGVCMKNVTILGLAPSAKWHCAFVSGFSSAVFPTPCPQLQNITVSSMCS